MEQASNVRSGNEWALLIHSHIPIGRAPEDLMPLINAVAAKADAENRAARVRALRDAAAADEVDDIEGTAIRDADGDAVFWLHQPRQVSEWLRRRADEIEADQ